MTITAKVIADSIADGCPRLTTLQLRYPRFIHSEFLTHRAFSRNASSSRSIPVERLIQDVIDDPAMPIHWGSNKPGMQAGDEVGYKDRSIWEWVQAMNSAVDHAKSLASIGLHKQIVNRVLEPFAHINVLVTATADAYEHFFALRDHPDAQPEIAELARTMRVAMDGSDPVDARWNAGWHTPYVDIGANTLSIDECLRLSAARCASVSYKTVDGKPMTVDKSLSIYDKLAGSDPIHASPFEHIARPDPSGGHDCRNYDRWHQWRSDLD